MSNLDTGKTSTSLLKYALRIGFGGAAHWVGAQRIGPEHKIFAIPFTHKILLVSP